MGRIAQAGPVKRTPDSEKTTRATPAGRAPRRRGSPGWLVAPVLALALALVGVGGYFAVHLLATALRPPGDQARASATVAAAAVCSDLLRQNYTDLLTYVDPSPAPPAATGAFDSQGQLARLRTLDAKQGRVTVCEYAPLEASSVAVPDGATRYLLTMRRSQSSQPIGAVLILRRSASGVWLTERDSSFLLAR